jgi:hypothetical protein
MIKPACNKRARDFITCPLYRPLAARNLSRSRQPAPSILALPATSPINPHSGAELRIIHGLSPVLHTDATVIPGAISRLRFSLLLCKLLHL